MLLQQVLQGVRLELLYLQLEADLREVLVFSHEVFLHIFDAVQYFVEPGLLVGVLFAELFDLLIEFVDLASQVVVLDDSVAFIVATESVEYLLLCPFVLYHFHLH